MPKRRMHEKIHCPNFDWVLYRRSGKWYADGRSNGINVGRHSLGTRDRRESLRLLTRLDLQMAVEHGLAEPDALRPGGPAPLLLDEGLQLFLAELDRRVAVRKCRTPTRDRYQPPLNRLIGYLKNRGIRTWNRLTRAVAQDYQQHLTGLLAPSTVELELTILKSTQLWFVREGHLPESCRVHLEVPKLAESDRYCWTDEELEAQIKHLKRDPGRDWLRHLIIGAASTGLRISELKALRWADFNADLSMITLTDEEGLNKTGKRRTLKGRRGRTLPVHPRLKAILSEIPRYPDGLVFHSQQGRPLNRDSVLKALKKWVIEPLRHRFPSPPDAVGFANGCMHSYRHYYASACANDGISESAVLAWLGHRSSDMLRRYYHLHDKTARELIQRVRIGTRRIYRPNRRKPKSA